MSTPVQKGQPYYTKENTVTHMFQAYLYCLDVLDENEVHISSAIVKYRDLTIQESLTVF